jgi:hypothetical protein
LLYPQPKQHCLSCGHCKRVIKPDIPVVAGALKLFEDSPREPAAEIRCDLLYWGFLPDEREKRYRSPWVAAKSYKLHVIASRCPDYDGE